MGKNKALHTSTYFHTRRVSTIASRSSVLVKKKKLYSSRSRRPIGHLVQERVTRKAGWFLQNIRNPGAVVLKIV